MAFEAAFQYLWLLFRDWLLTIFVVPIENWQMLWLLVPVWITWFFAEFFQEKTGTSLGNAITNAVVVVWGSIDCSRQTVNLIMMKEITQIWEIVARFALILALFVYGILIVRYGIKGDPIARKLGKIRVVTYVFIMFVPVFYNAIELSFNHIFASILFFPLYYFFIEFLDYIVPDPAAVRIDNAAPSSGTKQQPAHHAQQHTHFSNTHTHQFPHTQPLHGSITGQPEHPHHNPYGTNPYYPNRK
ncbi:MAG: hypothetical protein HGA85_02930 [Nanoarchaeota archaeon]|nr:hypothetical protein [Nanoarchaeota archaeon]